MAAPTLNTSTPSHSKPEAPTKNSSTSNSQVLINSNTRHRNQIQRLLQKATLLHHLLQKLYHHFQATSLSIVCKCRLWRMLTVNDQQGKGLWSLCFEVYQHSWGKKEKVNAWDTRNSVRLPDLPEELKNGITLKTKIGNCIRRKHGASPGISEESEQNNRITVKVERELKESI